MELFHRFPNIASTLIVSMTLNFPEVILLDSGLSFLGLGVQPQMTRRSATRRVPEPDTGNRAATRSL
jgi:ABC-type antimicrobial peptide transport system permease subunit